MLLTRRRQPRPHHIRTLVHTLDHSSLPLHHVHYYRFTSKVNGGLDIFHHPSLHKGDSPARLISGRRRRSTVATLLGWISALLRRPSVTALSLLLLLTVTSLLPVSALRLLLTVASLLPVSALLGRTTVAALLRRPSIATALWWRAAVSSLWGSGGTALFVLGVVG